MMTMTQTPATESAVLAAWRALLGDDRVLTGAAVAPYGANTEALRCKILAVLRPANAESVAGLVRIARRQGVPLYPVSTGKNWGYGSSNPPRDGCVIVDLACLNRIIRCDPDLGLVILEPGVTQQQLADYLEASRLPFMVPVTGAGPDCSIVANALERGYGLTPHSDHFAALMALEAVLPDGTAYQSPLGADVGFKWGVGPYLDGLFSQSGFGIVTQATIALARRPERIEGFVFALRDEAALPGAVAAIRSLQHQAGSVVGSINLMNARRVLAMLTPFPHEHAAPGELLPDAMLTDLMRRHGVAPWTGMGGLYGASAMTRTARQLVRQVLKPFVRSLHFATPEGANTLERWMACIPGLCGSRWHQRAGRLATALRFLSGRPGPAALALAYWKSGTPGGRLHPARDGCGLLWYAPLVPMKPAAVQTYTSMVERICTAYSIEPLVTLTSLSDRCFDSTVPLLFDRHCPRDAARAHACFDALWREGKRLGFMPYRLPIHAQQQLDPAEPCWRLGAQLKQALDPEGLFAPGRYSPAEAGA